MKVGFYETDITPSIGMERPADYHKLFIQTIDTPLKARAAVFSDGEKTVALVGVDVCFIGNDVAKGVRDQLKDISVTIAASHTHYGGSAGDFPPQFDHASALVRKLFLEESVCPDPDYIKLIIRQIVTAVKMADERMAEAELSFGNGTASGIAFNRRFKLKNGRCATHPGRGNPQIVEPAGPVDESVGVIGAWKPSGEFLGCVVNFTCHATCNQDGASSDYPGYIAKAIRAVMGENSGFVFMNGACGDVTQIDNQSLRWRRSDDKMARLVGTTIGAESLKVLMSAEHGGIKKLCSKSETILIKRRPPSPESLVKAEATVQEWKRDTKFHFSKERLLLAHTIKYEPEIATEIQIVQIGPLVIAAIPAEFFVQHGLNIKKASKFSFTWCSALSNGMIGYIPTLDAFDPEHGGGYETVLTRGTSCIPEAGDMIVSKASEMIANFESEAIPQGPLIEPAEEVWSYGLLGPELE